MDNNFSKHIAFRVKSTMFKTERELNDFISFQEKLKENNTDEKFNLQACIEKSRRKLNGINDEDIYRLEKLLSMYDIDFIEKSLEEKTKSKPYSQLADDIAERLIIHLEEQGVVLQKNPNASPEPNSEEKKKLSEKSKNALNNWKR